MCGQCRQEGVFYKSDRNRCKECVKAKSRKWYAENKQRAKARRDEWKKRNPEKFAKYNRRYLDNNPEMKAIFRSRRRYRERQAWIQDINPFMVYDRDSWYCGICGLCVLPQDASIDHIIPISKGGKHEWENVQLAHLSCNKSKGAKL